MKPSLDEFAKMGTGSEFIPVYREFLADLETPVSVLRRFAEEKNPLGQGLALALVVKGSWRPWHGLPVLQS